MGAKNNKNRRANRKVPNKSFVERKSGRAGRTVDFSTPASRTRCVEDHVRALMVTLTSAILSDDAPLLQTCATALLDSGADIFAAACMVSEDGVAFERFSILGLAQRTGSEDCLVWLMRVGLNLNEQEADQILGLLLGEIEAQPAAPEYEGALIRLFEGILRPSPDDIEEILQMGNKPARLGPRGLRIWRRMVGEVMAHRDLSALQEQHPKGAPCGTERARQGLRL